MTRTPARRPLAALTLAALLALASAGCGPSSGGTGTGASLAVFDAAPASVCSSAFASLLGCSGSAVTTPDSIGPGTTMTLYADLASGGNVAVTFQAHSVQVRARCQRIAFDGDWGIAAGNDARFFGSYVLETVGQQVPASVSVQAVGSGELQLVLRETDGRVVLGPVRLQPVAAAPVPAPCP